MAGIGRTGTIYYALPGLALAVPLVPVSVLLPSFYAQDLGLGFAATGGLLLLARLSDLVTDPLIGRWCDRSHSRFGRRKPFMLVGALLALISLIGLASPTETTSPGWLLGFSMTLYLGWTLVAIPYQTLAAELSTDYNGRNHLTAAREFAGLVGLTIAVGLPALAATRMTLPVNPLLPVVVLALILGLPGFVLFMLKVPEPAPARDAQDSVHTPDRTRPNATYRPPKEARHSPHPTEALAEDSSHGAVSGTTRRRIQNVLPEFARSFRQRLAALARMRREGPVLRLLFAWFCNGLANGLPAVLLPVYLQTVLGLAPDARYGFLGLYVMTSILGLPLWVWLARRLGKHQTWRLAMLVASIGFAPAIWLSPGQGDLFAAVCLVTGICLGADLALPPSMQADVADFDRALHGKERTALLFGWWSMSAKFATALAVGIAFGLLGVGLAGGGEGVDAVAVAGGAGAPGVAGQDAGQALSAARVAWLYAGLPVLLKLASVATLRGYPLNAETMQRLRPS